MPCREKYGSNSSGMVGMVDLNKYPNWRPPKGMRKRSPTKKGRMTAYDKVARYDQYGKMLPARAMGMKKKNYMGTMKPVKKIRKRRPKAERLRLAFRV